MLQQSGEYPRRSTTRETDILQPMLATKFTPNTDGDVWTYKLRPGVTFNNGAAMTADDVVYTFQQQIRPQGPGQRDLGVPGRARARTASRRWTT